SAQEAWRASVTNRQHRPRRRRPSAGLTGGWFQPRKHGRLVRPTHRSRGDRLSEKRTTAGRWRRWSAHRASARTRQRAAGAGRPDGERYRGRGFIQLTGRANYEVHGAAIGVTDLVDHPEQANEPEIAARLLASFLKTHEMGIKEALLMDDLRRARRLVNGGCH